MIGVYCVKYVDGVPVIEMPSEGRPPTLREAFASRCYLYGITEREKVAELWKAEEERLKAAEAKQQARIVESRKTRKQHGRRKR